MIMISKISARFGTVFLATGLCVVLAGPAWADKTSDGGIMPPLGSTASSAQEYTLNPSDSTHPMLRLTPDKTEMVHLDQDANSVIVGNPAHMNVLLENPRLLLIAPRQPGATQFTVLNKEGKVIMQRHVIVTGPKEDYIRIRRTCINGGGNCEPTTVYYCPDICHDVRLLAGQPNNGGQPGDSIQPAMTFSGSMNDDGSMDIEATIPAEDDNPEASESDAPADSSSGASSESDTTAE